jgi:hypothetical protein
VGAVKKHDRPTHYPGITVWGSTQGPVVYLGEVIRGNDKVQGVSVFLDERESREVLAAWGPEPFVDVLRSWGWHSPDEKAELDSRIAELEAELEQTRPIVAAVTAVAKEHHVAVPS